MDFILGIAEFLLQAIILLGVFLIAFAGVLALTQRKRGSCLLYTSPSPRDKRQSRMPSSA